MRQRAVGWIAAQYAGHLINLTNLSSAKLRKHTDLYPGLLTILMDQADDMPVCQQRVITANLLHPEGDAADLLAHVTEVAEEAWVIQRVAIADLLIVAGEEFAWIDLAAK